MGISQILFNRHGSIGGRAYWTGCAVLLCAGVVIHLLAYGFYAINPNMIGSVSKVSENLGMGKSGIIIPTLMLISLLFYPYLSLYTKRLRGIGVSAYWYIAVFLAYCVGFYVLVVSSYWLLVFLHFSPVDFFLTSPLPGASEDEIVAGIIVGTRKMLLAAAIFQASVHGVVALTIDLVLGKMKPGRGQQTIKPSGAVLA